MNAGLTNSEQDISHLPQKMLSSIIFFLPITKLFQIQSVCKLCQNISRDILDIHHNRFKNRVKLYSIIILKNRIDVGYDNIILSSSLEKVDINDPIYDNYISENLSQHTDKDSISKYLEAEEYSDEDYSYEEEYSDEDDHYEQHQTKNDKYSQGEEYEGDHSYDEENYYEQHQTENCEDSDVEYLEGKRYEYPYGEDCHHLQIECDVCNNEAFLPVMIEYTATKKDRYDHREYFRGFSAVCRKCVNQREQVKYVAQSNHYKNVNILIGMTCEGIWSETCT